MEEYSGSLVVFYDWTITNNDKVIKQSQQYKSDSFVKAFIRLLYSVSGAKETFAAIIDTSNTSRTLSADTTYNYSTDATGGYPWYTKSPATNTNYGLLIGTGNTAVTIDDYKLETLIAHGTGAGQMEYSAMSYGPAAANDEKTTLRFTRVFSNNSGGDITVKEIGLVGKNYSSTGYFLFLRDVLVSPETVLDGQSMTLNYNMVTYV